MVRCHWSWTVRRQALKNWRPTAVRWSAAPGGNEKGTLLQGLLWLMSPWMVLEGFSTKGKKMFLQAVTVWLLPDGPWCSYFTMNRSLQVADTNSGRGEAQPVRVMTLLDTVLTGTFSFLPWADFCGTLLDWIFVIYCKNSWTVQPDVS